MMASKYADGRIQASISMKAHRFFRDHSYPDEPLYKTVDRIVSMYKVSDVAPIVEEFRKNEIKWKNTSELNDELKKENDNLRKAIEEMEDVIQKSKNKSIEEFLQ